MILLDVVVGSHELEPGMRAMVPQARRARPRLRPRSSVNVRGETQRREITLRSMQ